MTGNHIIEHQLPCPYDKAFEFNKSVAVDTGIRCPTVDVSIDETIDYVFLKLLGEIINIIWYSEAVRHISCILNILKRTAKALVYTDFVIIEHL